MSNILEKIWDIIEDICLFFIKKLFRLPISDEKIDALIQFIKFGIVGVSNTAVHYCIYLICTLAGVYYMISNVIAFTVSVLNSFYWNRKYVFKEDAKDNPPLLLVLVKTFISYGLTGLVLSSILLYIEVDYLGISRLAAPIINLLITIPLNFYINKYWAYKI